HFPAIGDGDLGGWLAASGPDSFHLLDHIIALDYLPKDHVLAVQMRRRGGADEELRAVRVLPGIRHRQSSAAAVFPGLALKGFVIKARAIDRLAAGAVAPCEIAALAHKLWDYSVEARALVSELLSRAVGRADAEIEEVLGGLGDGVGKQF